MKNEEYGLSVVKIRMVREDVLTPYRKISGPQDAIEIITDELSDLDREMFCVINLRSDNSVINMNVVSIGTINSSMASPREVFKSCILSNAAGVLLVHNHPSGNTVPSPTDYEATMKLMECGKILDIPVVDHIIISGQGLMENYSFMEHGDMDLIKSSLEKKDRARKKNLER